MGNTVRRRTSKSVLNCLRCAACEALEQRQLLSVVSGTVTVAGHQPSSMTVTVFLDANDDGQLEAGEPYAIAASNGAYQLKNLSGEVGTIRIKPQSGCEVVTPAEGAYHGSTNGVGGVDFDLRWLTYVGGTAYDDANNSGTRDPGESLLAGVSVQARGDETGSVFTTTTGAHGEYLFSALFGEDYTITASLGAKRATEGAYGSSSAPALQTVNLPMSSAAAPSSSMITIRLFNDLNQNGSADIGEHYGLGMFYADLNKNGVCDLDEPVAQPESGAFSDDAQHTLSGLPPGTYVIRHQATPAWTPTTSGGNAQTVTISTTTNATLIFGGRYTQTVGGVMCTVFNDLDADGVRGTGESTLAFPVYIDANDNGQRDPGEQFWRNYNPASLDGLVSGDYSVRVAPPPGWVQTSPAGDGRCAVTVQGGAYASADFGVHFAAPATIAIDSDWYVYQGLPFTIDAVEDFGGAPAVITRNWTVDLPGSLYDESRAGAHGVVLGGINSTGDGSVSVYAEDSHGLRSNTATAALHVLPVIGPWLHVTSASHTSLAGDPVNLMLEYYSIQYPDWDWHIDWGDGASTDGAWYSGSASHAYDSSGTYTIRATARNASGTYPATSTFTVTIARPTGGVSGRVFVDQNGNGLLDAGDLLQNGATIFADLNNSGNRDSSEPSTTSASDGTYLLQGVPVGTAVIQVVVPSGFTPTTETALTVDIAAGYVKPLADVGITAPVTVSGTVLLKSGTTVSRVADCTVYVDYNKNGLPDPGEPSATTTSYGSYWISGVRPGDRRVRPRVPEGFVVVTPSASYVDATLRAGEIYSNVTFSLKQLGVISSSVYNDLNHNGQRDGQDAGMVGWLVFLDTNHNGAMDAGEPSTLTGSGGTYSFIGLQSATYSVVVLPASGWLISNPVGGSLSVVVTEGPATVGDFAAVRPATASGTLFHDANRDGKQDAGEPPLAGWALFDDLNYNAKADPGEAATQTDATGHWVLTGIPSGTGRLRITVPAGYKSTVPYADNTLLTLSENEIRDIGDTGFYRLVNCSGTVFSDADNDAQRDTSETGIAGAIVYADVNANGTRDADEPSATTPSSGTFTLAGIPEGSILRAAVAPAWSISNYPTGYTLPPLADGAQPAPVNFAAFTAAALSGVVFNDSDGDGTRDTGEAGIGGIVVWLDSNHNGVVEGGESQATTDAQGAYNISGLVPRSYDVRVKVPAGWDASGASSRSISVAAGAGGTASFGLTPQAAVAGTIFLDANADGILSSGEEGLAGRTVFVDQNGNGQLDAGEFSAVTGADGTYSLVGIAPGTISLVALPLTGWTFTGSGSGQLSLQLASAQQRTGVNIGAVQTTSVSGSLFHDTSGDAVQDPDEPAIAGWSVWADLNANGAQDPGEPTTTSNADGSWTLADLLPGTSTVRIARPSGWLSTVPGGDVLQLTLQPGQETLVAPAGFYRVFNYTGTIFNDANGNNQQDVGESGLAGATVFIDADRNGEMDAGEPRCITGALGDFALSGIREGPALLRAIAPPHWAIIGNTDGYDISLPAEGESPAPVLFPAVAFAALSGTVFQDTNGNGVRDLGELPLADQPVYIDLDHDGAAGVDEPQTQTDAQGKYSFVDLMPGSYELHISLPDGWMAGAGTSRTLTLGSGGAASTDFALARAGAIDGSLYRDTDRNGIPDPSDPPLAGWTAWADLNSNTVPDPGEPSATTDASGLWSIPGLAAGNYTIRLAVPAGWQAVKAASTSTTLALKSGETRSLGSAGFVRLLTYTGKVLEDNLLSGQPDGGEHPLAGALVFADLNGNGFADAGEPSVSTGTDGTFTLAGVPEGAGRIRASLPLGWTIDNYPAGYQPPPIGDAANPDAILFTAAATAPVEGAAFHDLNASGQRDPGEPGLAGATVWLDLNGNGLLDADEPQAVTGTSGDFSLPGIRPGTYALRCLAPQGFAVATPAEGAISVTRTGVTASSGHDFGIIQPVVSFAGTLFNDTNGDGIRQSKEKSMAKVVVFLDANGNRKLDAGEKKATTNSAGRYLFSKVPIGAYAVRPVIPKGYRLSTSLNAVSPAPLPGQTVATNLGLSSKPLVTGLVFLDANRNGRRDAAERTLGKVRVFADRNNNGRYDRGDVAVLTNSAGIFNMSALPPGTYTLRVVVPRGYRITAPGAGLYRLTLRAAQTVTGRNIGLSR